MIFFVMALWVILTDMVTVRGVKKIFPGFNTRHKRGIRIAFIIQVAASLVIILGGYLLGDRTRDYRMFAFYYCLFGLMLAVYLPKSVFAGFLTVDLFISSIRKKRKEKKNLPLRPSRHILAGCGIFVGLFLAGLFGWGILFGRYDYTIEPVEITFDTLPPAFDGYRIVQISDVHAGSFARSAHRFRKAVDMINAQNPDLIVFTGDLVNNFAEEAYPLIPVFSQLKAADGNFAVSGNHDYGGYYRWKMPADSVDNHAELKRITGLTGFELLDNRAAVISRDSLNRIALIGIENWGIEKRHPKEGDLDKATEEVAGIPFKILLSHDPTFWDEKIEGKTTGIALTLSGHTHGMQMGVKFGKERYSPARIRNRHWAGLYRTDGQYLYVNRGIGVIGFPGRIGMAPEITVITLRKRN